MAKAGLGSGQGRVRREQRGVMVRCQGEKDGVRCIERNEVIYPKGQKHLAPEHSWRCGKNACPVRSKNERLGQQKQTRRH